MRKFFQMVIVLSSFTVAVAAIYVYLTDKHVIVYKNGTIQTVDDQDVIFLNDGTLLYDDSIIEQNEIKDYSKRNIKHLFLDFRNRANKKRYGYESGLNGFFADRKISVGLQVAIPLTIQGLILFLMVRIKSRG